MLNKLKVHLVPYVTDYTYFMGETINSSTTRKQYEFHIVTA